MTLLKKQLYTQTRHKSLNTSQTYLIYWIRANYNIALNLINGPLDSCGSNRISNVLLFEWQSAKSNWLGFGMMMSLRIPPQIWFCISIWFFWWRLLTGNQFVAFWFAQIYFGLCDCVRHLNQTDKLIWCSVWLWLYICEKMIVRATITLWCCLYRFLFRGGQTTISSWQPRRSSWHKRHNTQCLFTCDAHTLN